MKNTTLVFLSILLFQGISYSQESENKPKKAEGTTNFFTSQKNTISLSPIQLSFSQMHISYERRFGKMNSMMLVGTLLHNRDAANNTMYGYSFGWSAEVHYRKYVFTTELKTPKKPSTLNSMGLYVSPFLGYQYLEREIFSYYFDNNLNNYSEFYFHSLHNAVQFGLLAGINFNFFKGRLNLDLYGGFAEKLSFENGYFGSGGIYPGILQFGVLGIIPRGNLQVGFNF